MSTSKQEREAERRGRSAGLIEPAPRRRPDDWIYEWERRDAEAIDYAQALVRAHKGRPSEDWPDEVIGAWYALVTLESDKRSLPFLRRLHIR